ncbi:MAG: hypothetical protein ABSC60_03305 [Acidobacteriota bacterium]
MVSKPLKANAYLSSARAYLSITVHRLGSSKRWTLSADYQHIQNPAYNRDRGPLWVASIRLHWEY